jgi:hypothetical protein
VNSPAPITSSSDSDTCATINAVPNLVCDSAIRVEFATAPGAVFDEHDRRRHDGDCADDEQPPVRSDVERQDLAIGPAADTLGNQGHQTGARIGRQDHADCGARGCEHEAFDEPLPDDTGAAGADGEAQSHFTRPGGTAGEQKIGHIHARDQQHQRYQRHRHDERCAQVATQAARAGLSRFDAQRHRQRALALRIGDVLGQISREQIGPHHIEASLQLLERQSRSRSREQEQPAGIVRDPALILRFRLHDGLRIDGEREVRGFADRGTVETRRRDAGDRHRLALDGQRPADHVAIAAEPPLPVPV